MDTETLSLRKAEGFIFTTIIVDSTDLSVNLYSRNTKFDIGNFTFAIAVFDNLHIGENFIMIKLPAGRYTFKYLFHQNNINVFELKDSIFEIKAGMINYTGSLYIINGNNGNTQLPDFKYKYMDNYIANITFLKRNYPKIIDVYPMHNSTPESSRSDYTAKRYGKAQK
jgi:hypothetical protein